LQSRYGISLAQYEAMRSSQKELCAVCQKPGVLHVDHHHSTDKVRGLLCHNCNVGLGYFKESPEALERAAAYLRYWHDEPIEEED
jgi:hypothetical protein